MKTATVLNTPKTRDCELKYFYCTNYTYDWLAGKNGKTFFLILLPDAIV